MTPLAESETLQENATMVASGDAAACALPDTNQLYTPEEGAAATVVSEVTVTEPRMVQVQVAVMRSRRFTTEPSAKERVGQLARSAQILTQLALPPFAPENERQFEEWSDELAMKVARRKLCIDLVYEAWRAACTGDVPPALADVVMPATTEELMDTVAVAMFPRSQYHWFLANELVNAPAQATVVAAQNWMTNNLGRYLRVIRRRGLACAITDEWLARIARRLMPKAVAPQLVIWTDSQDVGEIFAVALRLEASEQDFTAYPAKLEEAPEVALVEKERMPKRQRVQLETGSNCNVCGEIGHWGYRCEHRHRRCLNCGKIGHLAATCRSTNLKDRSGRVRAVVENRPGRVTLSTPLDRTRSDYSKTAADIMKMFQEQFAALSASRKDARKKRKEAKIGKSNSLEVDAQLPALEAASCDSSSSEDKDNLELCGAAVPAVCDKPEVSAWINKIECVLMIDTGASRSLCSQLAARRVAMKPTGSIKVFQGVGRAKAREMQPVEVIVEGQRAFVTFYEVDNLPIDYILGYPDLKGLQLNINTQTNKLVAWSPNTVGHVVACPQQGLEKAVLQQKFAKVDHVSGIDERLTDQQLLDKARAQLNSMTTHLSSMPEIREKIWELLVKYQKCWLRPRSAGVTKMVASFIVKGPPILQKLRYLPPEQKALLEETVHQMLERGVLRKSKSPWGSRPVFVKKKDSAWRMCLDYRQVNARMEADGYPLPLLWPNLQLASGSLWYTCLDCNWGFWNIPIAEESKKFTALVTHMGSYEFNVLPFGIRNSPGEFQRAMDMILGDLYGKGLLCYVDDIVIYGQNEQAVLNLFEEVLRRCVHEGLFLKLSKSEWFKPEVRLLGHLVGRWGIKADPRKVEALTKAKAPKSRGVLRSFLGLASYLRRFVPHFASIAAPLVDLMSPKRPFVWSDEAQESFQTLKTMLSEQVILTAPDNNGQFLIMTDASNVGIGAVLLQTRGVDDVAILEFASRKLTPAERRWDTREREAFAVKWAVERFHDYVQMGNIVVYTDHESLKWIDKSNNRKVQRWSLFLQQYGVRVRHIRGVNNSAADWLSRSCDDVDEDAMIDSISTEGAFTAVAGRNTVSGVGVFAPVVPTVHEFKLALLRETHAAHEDTTLGPDGLRYHFRTNKLYVPETLRESMMWWFHASKYGGHTGVNRMIRRLRLWVWWKGYAQDVKAYVGACLMCLRRVLPKQQTLRGVLTRPVPFQLVAIDYVGPRVLGGESWHYLVLIDHATRFVMAVATRNPSAAHAREVLETRWCEVFQAPKAVLSDRGVFKSELFHRYVTQELGAYHVFTSPYYPQGNAINEACHQGLEVSVSAAMRETNDIHVALRDAVKVHNAVPHLGTGESPYFLMFGFEPVFPGWQSLSHNVNTPVMRLKLADKRLRTMTIERMVKEERQLETVGDAFQLYSWVVFPLGPYEHGFATHPESTSRTMCPKMSLPSKVIKVNEKTLVVSVMGAPSSRRDVAKAICRILRYDVPPTLEKLGLDMMNWEAPRVPKSIPVRNSLKEGVKRTWGEMAKASGRGETGEQPRELRAVDPQEGVAEPLEGARLN